jgi:hypothetical protein
MANSGLLLRLGHYRFLPNPFQSSIQQSPYHLMLYTLRYQQLSYVNLKPYTEAYTIYPLISTSLSVLDSSFHNMKPPCSCWCDTHSLSLTHGAEPFLRSCQLCSYSRTSQHFIEPRGSLPCSQELSTCTYPEPDRSSPYHLIVFLQNPF